MKLSSTGHAGGAVRADGQQAHCLLCECRCAVDRSLGEQGVCQATSEARVYRHRIEYGEELELIPSPAKKFARTLVPEPLGATRITSTLSGATIPVCSL